MLESSEVRLVRCPKCENLLQEPSEFSVYQCGGCGTVLRAKKNGLVDNNGDLHVPDKVDDNATVLKDDFREEEKPKDGIVTEMEAIDKIIDENGILNSKNPSLLNNRGTLDVAARLAKRMTLMSDLNRKIRTSNNVQDSGNSLYNVNRSAYTDSRFETEPNEFMLPEGSTRPRPILNSMYPDRIPLVSTLSNGNDISGKRGFVNYSYPDEGPSNLGLGSYGNFTDQTKYEDHLDRLARVEMLENDRAELLRKLDELTDQLTRSCNVADVAKEAMFHDHRVPLNSTKIYDRNVAVKQPSHGHTSYTGRNGSTFLESYPNRNYMQEYRGFDDVYHHPHMPKRPPCQLPYNNKYLNKSCYEHFPGQYMDYHKPTTCSCMHPLNNRNNYGDPSVLYGHEGYINEETNLPFLPPYDRHPPLLTRSSSDLGVESNGFNRWRLKMPTATKRDKRVFHPIAGGAPFITCCNCSQVLKISKKLIQTKEKQNKIKCKVCSSILVFDFEKKGVFLSVPPETCAANYATNCHDFSNTGATNTSDEYEYRNIVTGQVPHSFSSGYSEDFEPSPKNLIHSSELISKDDVSLHLPDSPCDKYLDKPCSNNKEESFTDGKTSRQQNSLKDATEMDVSYDVHAYSSDVNKDNNNQHKINKGGDSFFLGIIKKSFGEFSRSRHTTENRRSNVSVNGHFVPDRVVKKAEKLAGPIQPGDYWYDYRAGFWGVMGHPCLGIILPNIDEFNYPMPEKCGGGNTGVYLNGRELHQKDLDLLASRGLPITNHKSYLIEISGRVVDEDTGEELDLGKLAPTVEKAKHGFGMKGPKTILKH